MVFVGVVAWVTHRKHTLVNVLELLWQEEVIEEVALDACVTREVKRHASCEVAVAQPACTLA